MNHLKLVRLLALITLLLLPGLALADRQAGEVLDDVTIATRVKGALIDNDKVSALHIDVEVHSGVVQLGGFVESKTEHDAALAATRRIGAAKGVLDAMVILPGSRSAGRTVDDALIQTTLRAKLLSGEGIATAHRINTEVRQGEVLLSGFVGHESEIKKAGEIAAGIEGVRKVHNRIAKKN